MSFAHFSALFINLADYANRGKTTTTATILPNTAQEFTLAAEKLQATTGRNKKTNHIILRAFD